MERSAARTYIIIWAVMVSSEALFEYSDCEQPELLLMLRRAQLSVSRPN